MSLRLRLTLLYSTLMGGILLTFGAAVYIIISVLLLNQADNTLANTARDIMQMTRVNSVAEIDVVTLPPLDLTSNVYVQLWGEDNQIKSASPSIANMASSLDPIGLKAGEPIYRENTLQNVHLRVLSVPLRSGNHGVGVLQVATTLSVADSARRDLLDILLAATIISTLFAGLGSWLVLGGVLAPLGAATETALAINRADDLSRRIPYDVASDDEIGSLIEAFNQTLERLENLFTSQQRFLADVSHELRTPLTVIKGNVDLIRRMKQFDQESLSSIDQEAGRLTRLVGGLLLLTQADSGKLTLNRGPVALDTLLLEVFQEMRILAGNKVRLKIADIDQVQINGDRDRLKQVLLNLVGNAIQYTPQGGDVLMGLARIGAQARIIVRDTGPGISSEDLPYIFDRFYRAEKSRTRSTSPGFGLGLSIAKWIVENHGGTINVESKEGKGTTFAIWLPLEKEPAPLADHK
ncbi:MAG TPA: HAMP domain-containing sensor histidine kinase [Anaerolineales bacterium]|nr:HAMP domain-containing sensor histidine kinase [Anaerolineales bacterium]